MSTNSQPEWPKSFRWHADFNGKHDIVTFTWEHDIDTDATGVIWAYRDCHDISVWVPTDQHRQKSPPAASQDDRLQKLLDETRMIAKQAGVRCSQESKNLRLIRCIELLADAVERLAK